MDKSSAKDSKSKKLLFLKSNEVNFLKLRKILGKISKLQLLISISVVFGYFLYKLFNKILADSELKSFPDKLILFPFLETYSE